MTEAGKGGVPPKQGPTTTKMERALRWERRFEANDNDHYSETNSNKGSVAKPELLILVTKNSSTITQPQTSRWKHVTSLDKELSNVFKCIFDIWGWVPHCCAATCQTNFLDLDSVQHIAALFKNDAMISAASQQLSLRLLTDPSQFYRAEAENLSKPHQRRRKYLEVERGEI